MAAAISKSFYDLEAMRKDDSSWHRCRVSLSADDDVFGIFVEFETCCEEESIISSKDEALTLLRFRSNPLERGQCVDVKEGEHVLALHKSQTRNNFFDAVIQKPNRVKHSNRVHCRCTFEIKWLNPGLEGTTMTVPSNSVMKLSKKVIGSHPVFSAFSKSLGSSNGFKVPLLLSRPEETCNEADMHGNIEKQIEEVSRLADRLIESIDDYIFGAKRVSSSGTGQNREVATTYDEKLFSSTTRSQNKEHLEMEVKNSEDKSCLTPLAACAAASLMRPLLWVPEFSTSEFDEGFEFNPSPGGYKKLPSIQYLDVTCSLSKSDAFDVVGPANSAQRTSGDNLVEAGDISRSSASSKKSNGDASEVKKSSQLLAGKNNQKVIALSTNSASYGKLSSPNVATRRTLSAAKGKVQDSAADVGQQSSSEKVDHRSMTKRLTRSQVLKENSNSNIYPESGRSNFAQVTEDLSVEDLLAPQNSECKKKRLIPSSVPTEAALHTEKKKRTRASGSVAATNEDKGERQGDVVNSPTVKKKAKPLMKPELPFLERRLRPRTRSQK